MVKWLLGNYIHNLVYLPIFQYRVYHYVTTVKISPNQIQLFAIPADRLAENTNQRKKKFLENILNFE